VSLPGIAAGFQEPADWDKVGASSRRAQPGLAVDPDGRRAFVVGAGDPLAVVDLRTLEVAWHRTEPRPGLLGRLADWLLPAAEAKSVHGPVRMAAWLGDGLMAVWGQDETEPVVRGPTVEQWLRPAGLRLVHLFGTRQVNWLQVNGGRAYVDLTPSTDRYVGHDSQATDRVVAVVDLERARVLAEWRGRLPGLLVGGCCVEPAGW
jgi:hypothetical protein